MMKPLRVLMVEDSEDDALLLLRELRKGGYEAEHERVETAEALRTALRGKAWDVILCDYRLPKFNGLEAIALLKDAGIDVPLIIVSGAIGEEKAAECMRCGAHDYVMKDNLSRLVPAVARELIEAESRVGRRRAEDALARSEDKFRKAFSTSPDAVNINRLEDGLYVSINPGFTNITGYTEEEIIGRTSIEFNIWHNIEDRQRLVAGLRKEGKVVGLEAVFRMKGGELRYGSMSASILDLEGVPHVLSITRDVTARRRSEEQIRESLEQVRRAIQATIQVLVMAVEVKDPYTAGHQRRMTGLARTMATEMGLPPEKIEGLRMAGIIHDIGKITLPTEILSKPTKLSAAELALVREHVRLGHDILKDVESSWPLAEMVLQHHERMDGSGYPRGLKGEEILIESRILAVADVVEAMASHRPYRPALGLAAALEEIGNGSGRLYDDDAVNACLRLFREKGYPLDEA